MSTIARFYVSEVTRRAYDTNAVSVTLAAVSRGPENKEWATATPQGSITMTIKNSPASKFFEERLGKDIAVTFDEIGEGKYSSAYVETPNPS